MTDLLSNQTRLQPFKSLVDMINADNQGSNFFGVGRIEPTLVLPGSQLRYLGHEVRVIRTDSEAGSTRPFVTVTSPACAMCGCKVSIDRHLDTPWREIKRKLRREMRRQHVCTPNSLVVDIDKTIF